MGIANSPDQLNPACRNSRLRPIGCIGRAAKDHTFPHARLDIRACEAFIHFPSITFPIKAVRPIQSGSKIPAQLPQELWGLAADVRLGGGAFNFCRSARLISRDLPLRYVDACYPDDMLVTELADMSTEARFMSQRIIPRNAIFGDRIDKIILKSLTEPVHSVTTEQMTNLQWLSECAAVVAHSVSDVPVLEKIIMACAARDTPLYTAITASLPPDFVRRTVLPAATVVFCGWDEVSHVTGFEIEKSLKGATEVGAWLSSRSPRASVFVTMGKQGALALKPGSTEAFHVGLRPAVLAEVQEIVAADAGRVCGCGDAFSAGGTLQLLIGRSLLSDRPALVCRSPLVEAAIAGSATALKWLGLTRDIGVRDFLIRGVMVGSRFRVRRGA